MLDSWCRVWVQGSGLGVEISSMCIRVRVWRVEGVHVA